MCTRSVGSPSTGITDDREPPYGCWESNLGLLKEQYYENNLKKLFKGDRKDLKLPAFDLEPDPLAIKKFISKIWDEEGLAGRVFIVHT